MKFFPAWRSSLNHPLTYETNTYHPIPFHLCAWAICPTAGRYIRGRRKSLRNLHQRKRSARVLERSKLHQNLLHQRRHNRWKPRLQESIHFRTVPDRTNPPNAHLALRLPLRRGRPGLPYRTEQRNARTALRLWHASRGNSDFPSCRLPQRPKCSERHPHHD